MAGITIKGLEELVKKIADLEQLKGLKAILLAAGETLKGKASVYPEQKSLSRASVYGQTFKSDKQRRYFFYALKKGIITVPYSRGADAKSERFKASWALATENDGLRVIVGNDTSYGPYLMDAGKQSQFAAAIGWKTVDDIAEANADEISQFVMYETSRLVGV